MVHEVKESEAGKETIKGEVFLMETCGHELIKKSAWRQEEEKFKRIRNGVLSSVLWFKEQLAKCPKRVKISHKNLLRRTRATSHEKVNRVKRAIKG